MFSGQLSEPLESYGLSFRSFLFLEFFPLPLLLPEFNRTRIHFDEESGPSNVSVTRNFILSLKKLWIAWKKWYFDEQERTTSQPRKWSTKLSRICPSYSSMRFVGAWRKNNRFSIVMNSWNNLINKFFQFLNIWIASKSSERFYLLRKISIY